MCLRIRLARAGAKGRPFYHMVVADERAPRDGAFIERVGTYDPMIKEGPKFVLKAERIMHWVGQGAQPSDRVSRLMGQAGLAEMPSYRDMGVKRAAREAQAAGVAA